MTDRYNYLTVALEQDIRADDAQSLIAAIKMLRGVIDVRPNVSNPEAWVMYERARQELVEKVWDALRSQAGKKAD